MLYLISKSSFFETPTKYPKRLVGGKAEGFKFLSEIPEWLPEFVILTSQFSHDVVQRQSSSDSAYVTTELETVFVSNPELMKLIEENHILIVRSSCENESLEDRGKFESISCYSNIEALSKTCSQLLVDQKNGEESNFALIIQSYIEPKAKGHLSNERRVSKQPRYWLVDYEQNIGNLQLENERFHIFKNRYELNNYIRPKQLVASSLKMVNSVLHRPAELVTLFNAGIRIHFEWVWDGTLVWVVQSDLSESEDGIDPYTLNKISGYDLQSHRVVTKLLKSIEDFDCKEYEKPKAQKIFADAGLETTNIWISFLSEVLRDNQLTPDARNDFEGILTLGSVVIRCDLRSELYDQGKRQNLPRSSNLKSIESIETFLIDVADEFNSVGVDLDETLLVIHIYIPSLASAFSYSDPKNPKVRIDSIWGLPDGLQFYAHDSYEVDTKHKETTKGIERHKNFMLGATEDEKWLPSKVGAPFDWRASISPKNRIIVADYSYQLAKFLGKPIQIMWFIQTPEGASHPVNVPWYFEEREIEEFETEKYETIYSRNLIKVSIDEDIAHARQQFIENLSLKAILLYPKESNIRNNKFLNDVVNLAKEFDKSIVFMGSILQHAYYQLKKNGVHVSCVEPFSPVKEIFDYDKLVRDKIPSIIEEDGELPEFEMVESEEHIQRLEEKLLEESNEVASSDSRQQRVEELADLFEVVQTLCKLEGITLKEVIRVKNKKLDKAGGFLGGIVLKSSETTPVIKAEMPIPSKTSKSKQQKVQTETSKNHPQIELDLSL